MKRTVVKVDPETAELIDKYNLDLEEVISVFLSRLSKNARQHG